MNGYAPGFTYEAAPPPNDGFLANTKAWHNFYLTNSGDANIGTYLPKLLMEAGFTIEHQTCVGGFAPVGGIQIEQ